MLDLQELRRRCNRGDGFQYLYFWGHQPATEGRVSKSCLSQWYAASFEMEGVFYRTAEHWMMASKSRLFSDDESLMQILAAADPKTAKALGRKVKSFDNAVWNVNRRRLVTEGNIAKFRQNPELGEFLKSTTGRILVEASPYDRVWGIGLLESDAAARDPLTWQGENLLGFALMDVRAQLFE